jgi:hypothetical protein
MTSENPTSIVLIFAKSKLAPSALAPANNRSPAKRPARNALIAKPILPKPLAAFVPPTADIAIIDPKTVKDAMSIPKMISENPIAASFNPL